ncbi:type VI secretion system Vgr family protein [Enterobacteriaceae bacterium LUAb1]
MTTHAFHRRYRLKIRNQTLSSEILLFKGSEGLSQPFRWRIEFSSPLPVVPVKALLMQPASLVLYASTPAIGLTAERPPLRTICGVITACEHLSTTDDQGHYAVTLEPRLALLSRSHQSAIYQQQSVPEIVERILRERHGMRGQDFLFTLSREYPKREQVMQYAETDFAFISRLLSEVGIWYRVVTNPKLNIDVAEFYDDQTHYQRGMTLPLVASAATRTDGVNTLWNLVVHHQVVEKSVSLRDYHWQRAMLPMDAHACLSTDDDPTTCGEACHDDESYQEPGQAAQTESGAFYARLAHERYLNKQTRISGQGAAPELLPGMDILITGSVPVSCRGGVIITRIECEANRQRELTTEFDAIPYSENGCWRPEKQARPLMAGTLPARITSTTANDIYAHIDTQGRYRVRFDFDRGTWKIGQESMWVQQAKIYAGEEYGLHAPLLAGTAVAIGFDKGNPDRPYIAHALHDARHPEHVTLHNYRRNVWRTPANNKLRLDDTRGEEHIKLATEYAKSQLSLGHLVDGQKQPRGAGFELRSDAWGSIRAGKGLFISADGQPGAQGGALEMAEALRVLEDAQQVTASLYSAAQQARTELAELEKQKALTEQALKNLQGEAILVSAPAGIGQVTRGSLQLSAGENLLLTSSGSADVGVLKKIRLAARETISLFAQKLGLKLLAAAGKVEIAAQSDEVQINGLKDIRISSQEQRVVIQAKQELVLHCGETYLKLSQAGIEMSSAKDATIKSNAIPQTGGATLATPAARLTNHKPFSGKFALISDTGAPVIAHHYLLTLANGQQLFGRTDEQGETIAISSDQAQEEFSVEMIEEDFWYDSEMVVERMHYINLEDAGHHGESSQCDACE